MSDSDPVVRAQETEDQSHVLDNDPRPTLWSDTFAGRAAHLLYSHNPFYVASAGMVFWGLHASFPHSSSSIDVWNLTLSLMGYTLLLSVTAVLVIRLGKVWEDARSLLLLIVLMFLGMSVTFDGMLTASPTTGARYYLLGWLFSATISEVLLRSLRLQMGPLLRFPFHLLLALFYFYPLWLAPRLATPDDPVLAWQLFGFSTVAALIFLTLLPAVRRGAAYVSDNGSPWPWPWFPWILFGMLGCCVAARAYYLCVSLHFVGESNSIFAPYFLAPLGLVASLLLLEAGIVAKSTRATDWALSLAFGTVLLAAIPFDGDPVCRAFLSMFERQFGMPPMVLTLWMVAGFYLYAAIRGIRSANYLLTGVLVGLAFVSPRSPELNSPTVNPLPLLLAGVWLLTTGWKLRRSFDVVAGACTMLFAAAVAGQETWFDDWHGVLPVHLLLVILLGAGYWFTDRTGLFARRTGIAVAVFLAAVAAFGDNPHLREIPGWLRLLYPPAIGSLLMIYGLATADAWSYVGAFVAMGVGGADGVYRLHSYLVRHIAGLNALAWGVLFFVVAAAISVLKAGFSPYRLRRSEPKLADQLDE